MKKSFLSKLFDMFQKTSTMGYIQYPKIGEFKKVYESSLGKPESTWWYAGSTVSQHYLALRNGSDLKSYRLLYRVDKADVEIEGVSEKPSEPWHKDIMIDPKSIVLMYHEIT